MKFQPTLHERLQIKEGLATGRSPRKILKLLQNVTKEDYYAFVMEDAFMDEYEAWYDQLTGDELKGVMQRKFLALLSEQGDEKARLLLGGSGKDTQLRTLKMLMECAGMLKADVNLNVFTSTPEEKEEMMRSALEVVQGRYGGNGEGDVMDVMDVMENPADTADIPDGVGADGELYVDEGEEITLSDDGLFQEEDEIP